ncbi:hypothetical protein GCM10022403_071250 [Streptomyces coacervatus]|uniref:Peptidase C14 caspase domain-containing protein n=1 Tax=Streptomyces coacervatus TaxID=647381 RepID=A0ABP7IV88_9ACTN|nr:WD40 repeat domain-containing protein [Streptomyces coacervatus]MDF2269747.1 WD40 repeat domain-containing protein [Streptomyces coacervatus]
MAAQDPQDADRYDGRPLQFFPVDIGRYDNHPPLPTEPEVEALAALLTPFGAETDAWHTPQESRGPDAINDRLAAWSGGGTGCDTVLYWVGHGASDGAFHALLAHAKSPRPLDTNGISHLEILQHLKKRQSRRHAGWAAVIVDACKSRRFIELMSSQATLDPDVSDFILVASSHDGSASLGAFREILDRLLTVTFRTHDTIGLYALAEQINCSMGDTVAYARTHSRAALRRTRPTVAGRMQAPLDTEAEIEDALAALTADERRHFVEKAAGGELGEQTWYFEGRETERYDVLSWLATTREGLLVVTGPAGSGKSALLGHVLIHTRPELADALSRAGHLVDLPAGTPRATEAFDLAVHLTGVTPQALLDRIVDAVELDPLPSDHPFESQMARLTGRLADRRLRTSPGEGGGRTFTLLADALDEAHLPLVIAEEVLRPLARTPGVRVVVGTRRSTREGPDLPVPDDEDLLDALGVPKGCDHPCDKVLVVRHDHEATIRYIRRRLQTAHARGALTVGQEDIERTVHALGRMEREFLFARLAVHEILHDPTLALDPAPLLDTDHRGLFARAVQRLTTVNPVHHHLLEALALSQGHGLPDRDDIWSTTATALLPAGSELPIAGEDIVRLIDGGAPYLMAATESGQTVYRLAHRAFIEHFARPAHPPDDDRHRRITTSLARRADARLPDEQPNPYVRHHLADHAALGGPAAWRLLDARPRLLDRLDATAVRGSAHLTGLGRFALPPAVAGVVAAYDRLADASDGDRRGLRELATARCTDQSTPPPQTPDPRSTWSLSWARLQRRPLHFPLQGHQGEVVAVTAFAAPDGSTLLASASDDGTVRLWDPATAEQTTASLDSRTGPVRAVTAYTAPGGRTLLATGTDAGTVHLWNPVTADQTAVSPLRGHDGPVQTVAVFTGPDGRTLLATGGDDCTVRVWDPATGHETAPPLTGHTGAVQAVTAFTAPDGRTLLASGGDDETLRVWDPVTGRQTIAPLEGHTGAVQTVVAFATADGRTLLASGSDDRTIRIWNPATGRQSAPPLEGHTDWIGELTAFRGPDGRPLLASCSDDETIRLWDPTTGQQTTPPLYGHYDKKWIGAITSFTGPDGRTLLATGSNDRTVRIWDPTTSRQASPALRSHAQEVGAVTAFTGPDGRTLLATGGDDDTARVWDAATGREIGSPLRGGGSSVEALAPFTGPDGQTFLAVCGSDVSVGIWDLATGRRRTPSLMGHTGAVRAVAAFRAPGGGTLLATGGDDRTVRVWDPATGQQLTAPLLGHTGAVRAVRFFTAADGQALLATGGNDATVRIWDPATGREAQAPLRGHTGPVRALLPLLSPEGQALLVTGSEDRTARVWDPAAGRQLTALRGHTGAVQTVTALTAPSGRPLLATGGTDRTVRLWDQATWTEQLVISVDLVVHGLAPAGPDLALATEQGVAVIRIHP